MYEVEGKTPRSGLPSPEGLSERVSPIKADLAGAYREGTALPWYVISQAGCSLGPRSPHSAGGAPALWDTGREFNSQKCSIGRGLGGQLQTPKAVGAATRDPGAPRLEGNTRSGSNNSTCRIGDALQGCQWSCTKHASAKASAWKRSSPRYGERSI